MKAKNYVRFLLDEDNPESKKPEQAKQPQENNGAIEQLTSEIRRLKEETVSKAKYEELEQQNAQLAKAIIDGKGLEEQSANESEQKQDLQSLAKSIFEDGISDYEMVKRELKYRERSIEELGIDPFAPNNDKMTDSDIKAAEKTAEMLQKCIDDCDGDPAVFKGLLNSRIESNAKTEAMLLNRVGKK